jgi:long-subunit fatty acid transport protein
MRSSRLLLSALVLALVAIPALAQNTDIESLAGVHFSFGNPGARALGMGGAFLGLADDASAAEANPAGLTILQKPEISFEGRNYEMIQTLNTGGVYPNITDEAFNSFSRRVEASFASAVLPLGNWAIAAYYHQPTNYVNEADPYLIFSNIPNNLRPTPVRFYLPEGDPPGSASPVSLEQCIALNETTPNSCFQYDSLQYATGVEVKLQTWGLALAYQMGNFSVGVAGRYQTWEEAAATFRALNGVPTSVVLQATLNDDFEVDKEDDFTYSAGFKWQVVPNFSLGGVYKKGPSFATPVFRRDYASNTFTQLDDVTFHAPDIYGVGLSYRPAQQLTINVDAVNVMYSNLVDDMKPNNLAISVLDDPYEADDVTELRAGAEYFFATRIPFAIRVGYWKEPAHAIKYTGPTTCTDSVISPDERTLCAAIRVNQAILFPGDDDQTHKSIGVGLAWPKFQIDAAYDTSDSYKVGSLTAVYRF